MYYEDLTCPLVRDVLGDGGQEVGGGEDLEVAVNLGIEARAIDDDVGGPFQGHLLNREGVAQDVLGRALDVGLGLGRHLLAGVDVEAAVFRKTGQPIAWFADLLLS